MELRIQGSSPSSNSNSNSSSNPNPNPIFSSGTRRTLPDLTKYYLPMNDEAGYNPTSLLVDSPRLPVKGKDPKPNRRYWYYDRVARLVHWPIIHADVLPRFPSSEPLQ